MKRSIFILFCSLPWLTSCQDNELLDVEAEGVPIVLSASIASSEGADTRTAYESQYPTSEMPLHAAVWLSTSGNFLNNNTTNGTNSLEAETTIFFQSKNDQLIKKNESPIDIVYPSGCTTSSNQVYFIGLHPDGAWNFTSGSTNTTTFHTFDGSVDLMFAPMVSGFIAISPNPKLHFYHMLTHLRVEVKAENEDVITSWGKLQRITLSNQYSKLDLSDLTRAPVFTATPASNTVSFSESAQLPFYAKGTDATFEATHTSGMTLPTSFEEVAYVLCVPTIATTGTEGARTDEYTILLDTANRTNVEVKVDLLENAGTNSQAYFAGSTMGHEFVLQLTFTASGYVSASARISPWTTAGYVSQDVEI